jgi:pathogenesis-related protein 1
MNGDETADPALEGDTSSVGQGPANAGTGGISQGAGGSQNVAMTGAGGSAQGGSSSVGGSGQLPAGGAGNSSMLEAAPGETGIFVGMTAAHNAARLSLNLDPPLPDLTWSQNLADFAQEWADTLVNAENCGSIFHRTQNMYGENIASRGTTPFRVEYAPEEAVESWFAEIDCWEYGTIRGTESCDSACTDKLFASGCGHFTQIAWRNSRQVGCGYATCQDGPRTNEVWVCNYDPPGNYVGQTPY